MADAKLNNSNPQTNLKSLVESLLFVAEGPATITALARALEVDSAKIDQAIAELRKDYAGRGIRVQRSKDRLQLVSAPESAQVIEKFLGLDGSGHLSTLHLRRSLSLPIVSQSLDPRSKQSAV
jgi:segregation and condensation protein B